VAKKSSAASGDSFWSSREVAHDISSLLDRVGRVSVLAGMATMALTRIFEAMYPRSETPVELADLANSFLNADDQVASCRGERRTTTGEGLVPWGRR
jgi:hypothetical protein